MTKREKILLFAVLALAGALIGWLLVSSLIIEPWDVLAQREQTIEGRIEDYQWKIDRRDVYERSWRELGGHTYAADPTKVPLEIRSKLTPAIKRVGLEVNGTAPLLDPVQVKAEGKTHEVVPVKVHGRGNLDEVLRTVHVLSSHPRLGALQQVTIEPASRSRRAGQRETGVDGKSTFVLTATYKVMWMSQIIAWEVDNDLPPPGIDAKRWQERYAVLADTTMFGRWQPPPPPPRPQPQPQPQPRPQEPSEPDPPPPPPPPAGSDLRLSGIYQTTRGDAVETYASVQNTKTNETLTVQVGEKLADGTVLALHVDGQYLVMEAGGKRYAVEAHATRTVADRMPLSKYVPMPRLGVRDDS